MIITPTTNGSVVDHEHAQQYLKRGQVQNNNVLKAAVYIYSLIVKTSKSFQSPFHSHVGILFPNLDQLLLSYLLPWPQAVFHTTSCFPAYQQLPHFHTCSYQDGKPVEPVELENGMLIEATIQQCHMCHMFLFGPTLKCPLFCPGV